MDPVINWFSCIKVKSKLLVDEGEEEDDSRVLSSSVSSDLGSS